jgi:hypothetical protein
VGRARSFDDLVAEGASVPVEGWDFSSFAGRASEGLCSYRSHGDFDIVRTCR